MLNDFVSVEDLNKVVCPVVALVAQKNSDYGGSVFAHGLEGIVVRMSDKMARLNRLVWQKAESQVKSESVADTFRDMIGYASLALVYMGRQEEKH